MHRAAKHSRRLRERRAQAECERLQQLVLSGSAKLEDAKATQAALLRKTEANRRFEYEEKIAALMRRLTRQDADRRHADGAMGGTGGGRAESAAVAAAPEHEAGSNVRAAPPVADSAAATAAGVRPKSVSRRA